MIFKICKCEWNVLLYRMSSKISGLLRSRCFIRSFIAVMIICVLSSAPCFELFSAAPVSRVQFNSIDKMILIFMYRFAIYFEGNRRWVSLCISHGIWHHIRCIWHPDVQFPTEDLRTRSNKLVTTLSTAGNCVELCSKSGRSNPEASSCRRAFSIHFERWH